MAVAIRSIFNTVNRSLKHKQILSRSLLFLSRPPSISASRGPLIAYRGFCDTKSITYDFFSPPLTVDLCFDTGHCLVAVEKPSEQLTRDQIIDSYINILAQAVGSEDEAKKKIFTVSTRLYYFGALHPEEKVRGKLAGVPGVECVAPLGIMQGEFGEPFINGKAAPYDPKSSSFDFRSPPLEEDLFPDTGHCLVEVEKPSDQLTRDQIIDSYINILAQAVGSEDEAKNKIFTVSTRFYFCFGALLPEKKVRDKLEGVPGVEFVGPLGIKQREFGEPFINGKAVPYDPKYHADFEHGRNYIPISKVQCGSRVPINPESKDKDSDI